MIDVDKDTLITSLIEESRWTMWSGVVKGDPNLVRAALVLDEVISGIEGGYDLTCLGERVAKILTVEPGLPVGGIEGKLKTALRSVGGLA